jgi:serine acetyltransferase
MPGDQVNSVRNGTIEGIEPVIPLLDLKAQYQQMKPEIDVAISRVIGSAQFILGPEVAAGGCGAIVGAGAVAARDVPEFAKVAGVPGRVIGWREERRAEESQSKS